MIFPVKPLMALIPKKVPAVSQLFVVEAFSIRTRALEVVPVPENGVPDNLRAGAEEAPEALRVSAAAKIVPVRVGEAEKTTFVDPVVPETVVP